MKVLCVNNDFENIIVEKPLVGKDYTVVYTYNHILFGQFYELAEFPPAAEGSKDLWDANSFVPLSEIDEMELVREREEHKELV